MATETQDDFNSNLEFNSLQNVIFVSTQLQLLKRFSHLNPMEAVRQMMETPDEICCHYKKYIMTIKSLIFQAVKICHNDNTIFYDDLNEEYFKPRQLFITEDQDNHDKSFEHMRILDFVIYKFVMVEPILDLIKNTDIGTAIMYKFMDDAFNVDAVFTSIEKHDTDYHEIHDDTYKYLEENSYSDVKSFFDAGIKDKLHVYVIQNFERTIDFDKHHQRTADMVEKPDETPKSLKRQRSQ